MRMATIVSLSAQHLPRTDAQTLKFQFRFRFRFFHTDILYTCSASVNFIAHSRHLNIRRRRAINQPAYVFVNSAGFRTKVMRSYLCTMRAHEVVPWVRCVRCVNGPKRNFSLPRKLHDIARTQRRMKNNWLFMLFWTSWWIFHFCRVKLSLLCSVRFARSAFIAFVWCIKPLNKSNGLLKYALVWVYHSNRFNFLFSLLSLSRSIDLSRSSFYPLATACHSILFLELKWIHRLGASEEKLRQKPGKYILR